MIALVGIFIQADSQCALQLIGPSYGKIDSTEQYTYNKTDITVFGISIIIIYIERLTQCAVLYSVQLLQLAMEIFVVLISTHTHDSRYI